jgi:hypothetical protein
MDRGKLYQQVFEAYKRFMSDKSTREAQDAAVKTWNRFKVSRLNIVDYIKQSD